MSLFDRWTDLNDFADTNLKKELFKDLENEYESGKRFYHNFRHIQKLLETSDIFISELRQPKVLLYAIWYHDVIYNPMRKDNENQSAFFAEKHLMRLNIEQSEIQKIKHIINRTANHFEREPDESPELELMLDADLQTLGSAPDIYELNTKNIRKEYSVLPDIIFNPGRAKILRKFLKMPYIYRTDYFRERCEKQARINIQNELSQIS